MKLKKCIACGKKKPLSDFYVVKMKMANKEYKEYPQSKCKVCHTLHYMRWKGSNSEKVRLRMQKRYRDNDNFRKEFLQKKKEFKKKPFRCMAFDFKDDINIFNQSLKNAQKKGFEILEKNKVYYGKVVLSKMTRYNNYRFDKVLGVLGYYHKKLNYFIPLFKDGIIEYERQKQRQLKLINEGIIQNYLEEVLNNG